MLMGCGDEMIFTLRLDDGSESTFRARRKHARGYNTIRVEQRVDVLAAPFDRSEKTMFEAPDYEVLEYRRLG